MIGSMDQFSSFFYEEIMLHGEESIDDRGFKEARIIVKR